MHRAAFAYAGLRGEYQAEQVGAQQLPARLAALRAQRALGANLSLPHKEAALPLLDSLTPQAQRIGAVNTVIQRQGSLIGDNTDAAGLYAALQDAFSPSVQGGAVVVLGAGGAARAAVYTALVSLERDVYIVNRTVAKAEALAQRWAAPQAEFQVQAATGQTVPWERVSLIINATSAGLEDPDQTPLPSFDFGLLPRHAALYDMIYRPRETRLMREARAAGLRAENGLGMLAHQARLAFLAWTGKEVPAHIFREAAEGEQPQRTQVAKAVAQSVAQS